MALAGDVLRVAFVSEGMISSTFRTCLSTATRVRSFLEVLSITSSPLVLVSMVALDI